MNAEDFGIGKEPIVFEADKTNFSDIFSSINEQGNYVINVSGEVKNLPAQTLQVTGAKVSLRGTGNSVITLSSASTGTLFAITSGASLILRDITLSAGYNNSAALVWAHGAGTSICLRDGAVISDGGGTGVDVNNQAVLVMEGGEISRWSRAIFVGPLSSFTYRSGTVDGEVLTDRGAVYGYSQFR